jgi:Flp pilus assembly protein TadD
MIWQDNYLLYKDAVAKSPQFARIRNEYGVALVEKGDHANALKEFSTGEKFDRKYILPVLNIANIKFIEGDSSEALKILAASYKDKSSAQTDILKMEARIYEKILFVSKDKSKQRRTIHDLIDTYHYIYLKDADPYIAYRRGQLLLLTGDRREAAHMFAQAGEKAPDDAFYKVAAKKLADKLR